MPRPVPGSPVPPQHFNFPQSPAPPHSTPQPEVVEQPDQDIHMDSDSSDELDVMSEEELQAEALLFTGLMDFGANAGLEDIYLSYDDALEYAFQTSNHFEQAFSAQGIKQHSPEPYQWKDIKGRPDADL